jgi:hypothetical protein
MNQNTRYACASTTCHTGIQNILHTAAGFMSDQLHTPDRLQPMCPLHMGLEGFPSVLYLVIKENSKFLLPIIKYLASRVELNTKRFNCHSDGWLMMIMAVLVVVTVTTKLNTAAKSALLCHIMKILSSNPILETRHIK